MTPSSNFINLIKKFEGLMLHPYLCPAHVPTIGYGSTYYEDGTKVTLKDNPITEERAKSLLMNTLKQYSDAVNSFSKYPLTQNQFDALVDFAYNVGTGALKGSILLKKVNLKDYEGASLEFMKWTHGGGKVLQGLVDRRKAEQLLFNTKVA